MSTARTTRDSAGSARPDAGKPSGRTGATASGAAGGLVDGRADGTVSGAADGRADGTVSGGAGSLVDGRAAGRVADQDGRPAGAGRAAGTAAWAGAGGPFAEPMRPRPLRATGRLLRSELGLTFRRPRNIAMLVVLAVVPVIMGVVLRVVGMDEDTPSIVTQVAGNGVMLTFVAMSMLIQLLLPLAVAVVAGESIAGEAGGGTLRYLLTAPAGRTRLLLVKFANMAVFALAACAVVALAALVTGFALFPVGPVTLLSGTTIPLFDGLLRLLLVVAYCAAGMAAFGAIGIAVSTMTEVPIGAVAGSVVGVVFFQVFSLIPQLEPIRPYLLTTWWSTFDGAMRDPVATDVMTQGLFAFASYALIAGAIAWGRFTSRDITS
ncbi:ABC transporter permease subunit [Sphaerisporangium sp. TRM90804]|uniref:ABC transporter permease n=1 Tax=Sphaerisporangium sp. TRM90804 TaxID=3031113 RepID=UPI00244C015E|nr:ABC transporter permease subunit [Sphaerisporangium sp. TRM90804]MDH2429504.1 ABC transporter permease subunit [Sphaerisporangium sp. TRM90804]